MLASQGKQECLAGVGAGIRCRAITALHFLWLPSVGMLLREGTPRQPLLLFAMWGGTGAVFLPFPSLHHPLPVGSTDSIPRLQVSSGSCQLEALPEAVLVEPSPCDCVPSLRFQLQCFHQCGAWWSPSQRKMLFASVSHYHVPVTCSHESLEMVLAFPHVRTGREQQEGTATGLCWVVTLPLHGCFHPRLQTQTRTLPSLLLLVQLRWLMCLSCPDDLPGLVTLKKAMERENFISYHWITAAPLKSVYVSWEPNCWELYWEQCWGKGKHFRPVKMHIYAQRSLNILNIK